MSASLAHELSEKPHTPEDLALLAEVVKECQRDRLAGKSSLPAKHCNNAPAALSQCSLHLQAAVVIGKPSCRSV